MSEPDGSNEVVAANPRPSGRKTVEGGSRWRLRNWRLRTKLVAVLLVPVITAVALGVLRATNELDRAETFDQAAIAVTATLDVTALVHEMQSERNVMVAYVAGGRAGDISQVQGQMQKTNATLTRLNQAVAKVSTDNGQLLDTLSDRLSAVEAVRSAAMNSKYPDVGVYQSYTSLLEAVLSAGSEFTASLAQPEIARLAAASLSIVEAKEFLGRQNSILMIAGARNGFPSSMLDQARAAEASYNASIANFRSNADVNEAQFFSDTFSGAEVDDRERIKQTAFVHADQGVPNLGIEMDRLVVDSKATATALQKVEVTLLGKLRTLASQSADAAKTNAWRDAVIVLIAILLALIVTFIVARSLLVPLRVLRRDALDVANRRLPETVQRILADPDPVEASKNAVEPVPVFTREETGQLARSFDAVHDQAVRMATEQALLRDNINSIFVNLSRRSQTLVERQLSLIDRLEQDEQDPDQLASLFELDHLATRMRRNSESLLVLSGSGLSRQLSRPVPAAEVVGAAVSEVEQYARIEVLSAPEVSVQGRAVSDLVHLIAELLDNATSFSEPEKKVYVRMAVTRKKELAIQITDSGVGMNDEEIETANSRLADPPDIDVAVTRRMGLYVVARLAKRHDIKVRLRDNEDIEGGLIARITVPANLVQTSGSAQPTSIVAQTPSLGDTAAKASGIAGAFTGSMPRTRPETAGPLSESLVDRPAEEVAGYPAFDPASFASSGNPEDTGGWGPPASPEEIRSRLNGHLVDNQVTGSLFGLPLPEPTDPPADAPRNGTGRYHPVSEPERVVDAPTERLPIYEAVLSQWFEAGDTGSTPVTTAAEPEVEVDAEPEPDHQVEVEVEPLTEVHAPVEVDHHEELAATPEPAHSRADAWHSPGDDGWQRARALLDTTADTTTTAGLPKRVPKAHLVPGSAAPRETTAEQPAVPALPPRTADAVRGRMSQFQQGVRRGRHALIDAYAGDQTGSDESRQDEEQE
ncbi:sensor histidine kinase [Actinokineospora globicatena]|uniref:sensor histidine kinase n=1 Tax=Actinokineospora globicatena TaxID=103729 RepID=UPI0020A55594|nr:nitrate- and nitrite sensing domain-containing protein [Actinokineospora globicatena]GLW77580.1 histidine kinase [Actinokineospora globicatena]GLW84414.1 histidine kinase [Actinokineospora globicatena]